MGTPGDEESTDPVAALTFSVSSGDAPTPAQSSATALATRVNRINLIWEYTQSFLAVLIVTSSLVVWIRGKEASTEHAALVFLVVGFYFGRTNHARPGGGTLTGGGDQ